MGLFFNKERDNKYLKDQKAVYDTDGDLNNEVKPEEDYNKFIFQPKDYSHVPKYKANDEKEVGVVVDNGDWGYTNLNSEVETVQIEKDDLYKNLSEIINNQPIEESDKKHNTSVYDEKIYKEIKKDEPIEILEVDNVSDFTVSSSTEQNLDDINKLSIFGTADEPISAKVYEVKQIPGVEKIDIIDVDIISKKHETLNSDGKKVCKQCGAPSEPDALECFLCKNKF